MTHETELDIEDLGTFEHLNGTSTKVTAVPTVQNAPSPSIAKTPDSGEVSGVPGTQRLWIKTFGCSHNTSDAEYMAGQLAHYGYTLVPDENADDADLWLINSCTVKGPSQTAIGNLVRRGRDRGKALLVSGCVPQGDKSAPELKGVSLLGVTQIDRVVEAVEETMKGNTVELLSKKSLPRLDLPKVRRNPHVEILPLSTGCLGACTYCKTKHARGHLGSYSPEVLIQRVKHAVADPLVREIWLSSEDTGAYGRDLGTNLPTLLQALIAELPSDGRTMLRIGMTNPPFILEHLEEIADALSHPACFSYLHVPVQSGSNPVLTRMNREYTVEEFEKVCDFLSNRVPNLSLATDIIAGFPGETESDHSMTLRLLEKYKFPHTHISQFYPRPGTPAARMKRVPTEIVKRRSREISSLVESWTDSYESYVGTVQRCMIVEKAADGTSLVGHTKSYAQVLIPPSDEMSLLGCIAEVKIISAGRWSVKGEVIKVLYSPDSTSSGGMNIFYPPVPGPILSPNTDDATTEPGLRTLTQKSSTLDGITNVNDGSLDNIDYRGMLRGIMWISIFFGVIAILLSSILSQFT